MPKTETVESGPVTLEPVGDTASQTTSGDDEFLSEDDLKAMSFEDLVTLCKDNGIDNKGYDNKEDLLDYLMKEYGV